MGAPISAEVVNAFVSSLLEVFQATTGMKARLEPLKLASSVPPPPGIVVTIELSGRIIGPTIWTFEPEVARAIAAHMLSTPHSPAYESAECLDSVAEVANILVGNVIGALADAGYPVEISAPTTELPTHARQLSRSSLNLSVSTDAGLVSLLLAVTQDAGSS